MTEKIAIGIPGLSHRDEYILTNGRQSSAKIASDHDSTKLIRWRGGRGARFIRSLRFVLDCLAVGSRTVALADNSQLLRDLSARARLLYGLDEC
jgi:hypothetical protein